MSDKYTYHSPNEYTQIGRLSIPSGNHRVKISNVEKKIYGNSGKEGFEITLKVSNRHSLLWLYLVWDPENEKRFNRRLASFFSSFNITDDDLTHYKNWIGKLGAVNVRSSVDKESGLIKTYVYYFLSNSQQYYLPPFRDVAQYRTGELDIRILSRYLNEFDGNQLWDYYRLILGLRYKEVECDCYCFMSDRSAESIKQALNQACLKLNNGNLCLQNCELCSEHYIDKRVSCSYPCIFDCLNIDKEILVKILLKHIDKNHTLARKMAKNLLLYNYEWTVKCLNCELIKPAMLFGNDLFEIYYTEERKAREREEEEWQKEFERELYEEYHKDEFRQPSFEY